MVITRLILLILAMLASIMASPLPEVYVPRRFVYSQPIQLSPMLPMEVRRAYTGNGNSWRWGSTRSNLFDEYLYNPETSYFRYPLFHADYSPTHYINPRYLRVQAAAAQNGQGQTQATVPTTSTGAPPPVESYYPSDYYQTTTPTPRPYYNYNYNYNYGAAPVQTPTTTRGPVLIEDYWNRYSTPPPPVRSTTTAAYDQSTLRGTFYSNNYGERDSTTMTSATRRPHPPEAESLLREWESVPVPIPVQTTPRTTTTTTTATPPPTTTTRTTTMTPFETEEEIKAEEHEREVVAEPEPDEDSDEDDDDDDDWDF